ncbi:hypothetical protein NDU88_001626 [Pleurodeles waltl]|uniref:Uncharacterized protein n=1 Tax=Pleurodeles waltl TaxID=8319 RepID=A0AAV7WN84_PLEWA|nr:hypothetical protein NDU88_001626 [Pleurodeles waltl]
MRGSFAECSVFFKEQSPQDRVQVTRANKVRIEVRVCADRLSPGFLFCGAGSSLSTQKAQRSPGPEDGGGSGASALHPGLPAPPARQGAPGRRGRLR